MSDKSMDGYKVQDVLSWIKQKRASEGNADAAKLQFVVPSDTLGSVVNSMAKHDVCSMPVIENFGTPTEKYHGTLDISSDIVGLAMGLLGEGELNDDWKGTIEGVLGSKVSDVEQEYHSLPEDSKAQSTDCLPTVVRHGFVRNSYKRLTIFEGEHASAILSQSDLVEFIAEYPKLLGNKAACPLQKLGHFAVAKVSQTVTDNDTVLAALRLCHKAGKREVAVVDAEGKLTGAINAEAIKPDDLSVLQLPIGEYKKLHSIAMPVTISPAATLSDAVAAVGPRRAVGAYAVDGDGKPVFSVTLDSVLRSIINSGWELNDVTVADVCKLSHPKLSQVVTLEAEQTIGHALKELAAHNMLTLPVLRDGTYVGMVDVMDILGEIICCLEDKQRGTLREDEHPAATYQHAPTDKEVMNEVSARSLSNLKYTAKDIVLESSTIHDAILGVFLPHRYHRVSIKNSDEKIINVLSQRDIAKFLSRYPDILGDRGLESIETLGFLKRKVRSVGHRETMMKAFQVMHHSGSRAVAVVNGKGQLVTNVHAGDLKGLTSFYHLRLMICFAKSSVPNPEDFPSDSIPLDMPLTCTKDASLQEVLAKLNKYNHRRVYVLDEQGHPLSEVTLSDIFKSVIKPGADSLFSKK